MLKQKALRKIVITTTSIIILIMIYLIPTKPETKFQTSPTSLEIEYISGLGEDHIYLLNENNFLVKNSIILSGESTKNKIKNILEELTFCDCNYLPDGLYPTIPKDTKINSIEINNNNAIIDFSKDLLNQSNYLVDKMIESIVYSITDLDDINSVTIKIDGKELNNIKGVSLDNKLSKDIGINKTYEVKTRDNIDHITIYYMDQIQNKNYYVPVTKYLNLSKEKIEVIIESLANEYIYENNLISKVNQHTKLLNYSLEGYSMILNFNNYILNKEGKIDEDIINTICYSIFDNYDVNEVVFQVEGKEIIKKSIKNID